MDDKYKDRMDKPEFDFTSLRGNIDSYRLGISFTISI